MDGLVYLCTLYFLDLEPNLQNQTDQLRIWNYLFSSSKKIVNISCKILQTFFRFCDSESGFKQVVVLSFYYFRFTTMWFLAMSGISLQLCLVFVSKCSFSEVNEIFA